MKAGALFIDEAELVESFVRLGARRAERRQDRRCGRTAVRRGALARVAGGGAPKTAQARRQPRDSRRRHRDLRAALVQPGARSRRCAGAPRGDDREVAGSPKAPPPDSGLEDAAAGVEGAARRRRRSPCQESVREPMRRSPKGSLDSEIRRFGKPLRQHSPKNARTRRPCAGARCADPPPC